MSTAAILTCRRCIVGATAVNVINCTGSSSAPYFNQTLNVLIGVIATYLGVKSGSLV